MVLSGSRILVTGSTGFIGRAVTAAFVAAGYRVRGSVRRPARAADLPLGVEPVVVPDAGPGADWAAALDGVDVVVHLAGCAHRKIEGAEHYRVNAEGSGALARAAARAGVRRFVFLSTIKVHGEGGSHPYVETDPCLPRDDYAASKLAGENAVRSALAETSVQTVVMRPPMVYGPGVKANFLKLMGLVDRCALLPLGSVANRRSLLFVENLVSALYTAVGHPAAAGKTFLVADREAVSTPDLIRGIAAALGHRCRLVRCPVGLLQCAGALLSKRPEVARLTTSLWADTAEIGRSLGWSPPFTLMQGLPLTAAWYRGAGIVSDAGEARAA